MPKTPSRKLSANPPTKPFVDAGAPVLQRETVMETVAARIESLIRSGQLSRGSRLPSETRLAEMLGVSRASLREVLKAMVFLGLIKARAGDGTYLQPSLTSMVSRHFQWMLLLQEIKFFELYELRQILEPAAAALAARRATRDDLQAMRSALQAMRAALDDPESFVRAELDFHDAITQASQNVAIQSTMRMMYGALAEGRHRVLPLVESIRKHCAHHGDIYKLIADGDATKARRAIAEDLKYGEALLLRQLQAEEAKGAGSGEIFFERAEKATKSRSAEKKTPHTQRKTKVTRT